MNKRNRMGRIEDGRMFSLYGRYPAYPAIDDPPYPVYGYLISCKTSPVLKIIKILDSIEIFEWIFEKGIRLPQKTSICHNCSLSFIRNLHKDGRPENSPKLWYA